MTRYGDPYTGGTYAPQLYTDSVRKLAELTNGEVAIQPTTFHFFANNYVDGISKIFHSGYGVIHALSGDKTFDPKYDLIGLSSFIGRKADYDAREYASVQTQMERKRETFNMFKNKTDQPELLQRYLERHPNDPMLIWIYNKIEQQLKPYRSLRKDIEALKYIRDPQTGQVRRITSKERKEALDKLRMEQNLIKRSLIDAFKSYNVKP